jgi:predicted amidohydrolase YtcJ
MHDWDLLLTDARIATMRDGAADYGVASDADSIAIKDGRIV